VVKTILLSMFLLSTVCPVNATTITISADGSGDYPTIQEGVIVAAEGDVVELLDGTYIGPGNRDVIIYGKSITVKSNSSDPSQCIIDCEGSESEPHRGFLLESPDSQEIEIEGISIVNGYSDGISQAGQSGGAILCMPGITISVSNCIFMHNSCESNGGAVYLNGGTYDPCIGSILNCVFESNISPHGCSGLATWQSDVYVQDCDFINNIGGMYANAGEFEIRGCRFIGNYAAHSGNGAGVVIYGPYPSPVIIEDCLFSGNVGAGMYGRGGAVYLYGDANISSSTFVGNEGIETGALHISSGDVNITSCTFHRNISTDGASGITIDEDWDECIIDNTIITFGIGGEAINADDGATPTLSCSNLYENEGGDYTGMLYPQEYIDGNLSHNPLFCDPETDELYLEEGSPCGPHTEPNPECDLIGAWTVGCGGTAIEAKTWGGIKAQYR
jgi:hypothetical protein